MKFHLQRTSHKFPIHRTIAIFALIAAGEAIFFLPFVIARVFRPTLLEVFKLTNLELGTAFSLYGIVAMAAYFPGGPLADRFPARKLMSIALMTTSIGGVLLASVPPLDTLNLLYAFWGLTTILLFWAALIRATREWGGEQSQGVAFGLLDGGRGLVTAVIGTIAVTIFAILLPTDVESASLTERTDALKKIILLISASVFAIGIWVWFALQADYKQQTPKASISFRGIKNVLKMPSVWLQSVIIICAYVGFKGTDDFSLYAKDTLGFDEVDAAKAGAVSLWIRPIAAIAAGIFADWLGAIRMTAASFVLLFVGSIIIASGILHHNVPWAFFLTIISTSAGIFALRGLYYAIMKEGKIPLAYTGSAVGVVSVIGYTPDIFMGPLMGILLDKSPGELGHQHVFGLISGFALVGFLASLRFQKITISSISPP